MGRDRRRGPFRPTGRGGGAAAGVDSALAAENASQSADDRDVDPASLTPVVSANTAATAIAAGASTTGAPQQPVSLFQQSPLGKATLGGLAVAALSGTKLSALETMINGISVGAITYCFRSIPRPATGEPTIWLAMHFC